GIADGNDTKLRPLSLAEHLPRHDVRVVLHRRDDDLVAGTDVCRAVGGRNQIDRLGGSAHEHDLAALARIQEAAHQLARIFIHIGRAFAQPVDAAMDVGVLFGVKASDTIDHRIRLLSRRGVVEIDERFASNALPQDRKIVADHGLSLVRIPRVVDSLRTDTCRVSKEVDMAQYLLQVAYTPQAWSSMLKNPQDRTK